MLRKKTISLSLCLMFIIMSKKNVIKSCVHLFIKEREKEKVKRENNTAMFDRRPKHV